MIEGPKLVPESTPSFGGKMRLPAPKNIENSMSAVTTIMEAKDFEDSTPLDLVMRIVFFLN